MASVKKISLLLCMIQVAVGLAWPRSPHAGPSPQNTPSQIKRMSQVVSVGSAVTENGTTLTILGNGAIPDYVTTTLLSPPRVVIDIPCETPFFKQKTFPVKASGLGAVRIGWHPERVRIVLDITDTAVPEFASKTDRNTLIVSLGNKAASLENKAVAEKANRKESQIQTADSRSLEESTERQRKAETRNDPEPRAKTNRKTPSAQFIFAGEESKLHPKFAFGRLLEAPLQDKEADTALFLKGVRAFKAREWKEAAESFTAIAERFPGTRYSEKAAFLQAKSYDELHRASAFKDFSEIKSVYENAMSRYPNSPYFPEVFVALGDLCARVENHSEALAYFGFATRMGNNSAAAQEAVIKKARVLSLKKKEDEARALLGTFPEGGSGDLEVRLEFAKVLYETQSYQKSLALLKDLDSAHARNRYEYPQIAIYSGLNHFQLGEYGKAREKLYWYYNISPEKEGRDLILATIGDSYRNDGLIESATKVYQLLTEFFPGREGFFVGLMRLADQQEKGEISSAPETGPSADKVEKPLPAPKEIYEEVIKSIGEKDDNALYFHAVIKLAAIHEKENDFEKSAALLRELEGKQMPIELRNELKGTLRRVIEGLTDQKLEQERFSEIVEHYLKEESLFTLLESPKLFMAVGRALSQLRLESAATPLFRKADSLLSIKEKPSDLLYALGVDLYRKGKMGEAMEKIRPLLDRKPIDEHTARAAQLSGKILLNQKNHHRALEMFSQALNQDPDPCLRIEISTDKARALIEAKSKEEALKVLAEAERYKEKCAGGRSDIFKALGEVYVELGRPDEAAANFREALMKETEGEDATAVKFMLARCYESLSRVEDSFNVYREIQGGNDAFWSNLARERIEEVKFGKDIGKPLKGSK
jgi:tetratricopeptide (TPR) repeat protein